MEFLWDPIVLGLEEFVFFADDYAMQKFSKALGADLQTIVAPEPTHYLHALRGLFSAILILCDLPGQLENIYG